jgi:hypothetical protein
MPSSDEQVARLFALATSLGQSLERERVHVEAGRPASLMKEIYDAVYLPRLIALSLQADRYVEYEDWHLLCQPLHPDLASTQLSVVVELLFFIVLALNPPHL